MNRILIIDDEEEICALLSGVLRKQGYEVEAEHTIKGGLNSFRDGNFDLVLLDLNLTDGYGLDLIPKLKEIDPKIDIYIISAYDGQTERKRAIQRGARGFIGKPFNREMIFGILENRNIVQ